MFIFSLAKELRKTVRELERDMGADELMEWVAYYKATDKEESEKLRAKIAEESTEIEKAAQLRAFFKTLTRRSK